MELLKQGQWIPLGGSSISTQLNTLYQFTAANLTSLTSYSFRLHLLYAPEGTPFFWPDKNEGLIVSTRGNAPAQPRAPQAKKSPNNLVELWWGPTPTNGYPIQNYILEMKTVEEQIDQSQNTSNDRQDKLTAIPLEPWIPIYNGSGTYKWLVKAMIIDIWFLYFILFIYRSLLCCAQLDVWPKISVSCSSV